MAARTSKALAIRPAQLAKRPAGTLAKPAPKTIELRPASDKAAKAGKAKSKKGKASSGGSAANRTDESTESEIEDRKAPSGVVLSSRVVDMLVSLGLSKDDAEEITAQAQLSQDNPRVGTSGPVNRRDGGAGFGRGGGGGGGGRPPKRGGKADPAPAPKFRTGTSKPLALPASPGGGGKPLALPASPGGGGKPLALPAPKSSGLTAQNPVAPPTSAETKAQIDKIPPSILRAQAIGAVRGIEDLVRTIFEPAEATTKKALRAEEAIKKATAEGEIGKVIDLLTANAIEFEDEADKKKTYSWLERMIRKIQ